ncbi:MAG: T9SS type A sorting domain-containing protein, partial [Bacteroidetes bacterium]|nr:T9SS type A sorting domain-containing protein [Bacteroidota bacterium]
IKIDTNGIPLWDEPIYAIIDSLNHRSYELIPDDSGGCFISTSSNYIETNVSYGQKSIQHISSSGERLWGEQGILIYEGFQSNGLQSFPPKIHPRSDNNLFVYVVTNLSSAFEIYLFSYDGEQLLSTEYTQDRRFFNTFLNSNDELLVLTYDNTGGFPANNLILGTCIVVNDTITFVDSTLLQPVDYGLYHTHSTIDKKNNIHLLWRFVDDNEELVSYYKKITNEPNGLYDSIGVKLVSNSFTFLLENDTNTFLLDNQSLYRIDSLAQPIWGEEGLQFTLDDCTMFNAKVLTDNNLGIIVLWNECVSGVRGKLINKNGEIGIVTRVDETNTDYLSRFVVSSNYPNPFNPSTTIMYDLPQEVRVNIKLYDLLGQEVATIVNMDQKPGTHILEIDLRKLNSGLASGVYFYRMTAGKFVKTKKMLLLK